MKKIYYAWLYSPGIRPLFLILFCLAAFSPALRAQSTTTPVDGIKENAPAVHALTNATIVAAPGRVLENATLIIRNGSIEAVGTDVQIPADARIWDLQDKTIYPGFIDAHSALGMQDAEIELENGNLPWNQQIRAQLRAESSFSTGDEDGTEALRAAGFTQAFSVPDVGIFRGQAAVMSLADGSATDRLTRPGVAQAVSMNRDGRFGFTYPTSPIGVIALIRQTFYDAAWYRGAHQAYNENPAGLQRPETNAALAALDDAARGQQPVLFEVGTDEQLLRALRITDEFEDIQPWIRGSGHEYRLLDVLADERPPLILPLHFPETPDVETPEDALNQNMAELRHWYLAPENPARVAETGLPFALTTHGLEDAGTFMPNLRKAIARGLSKETALTALTQYPAELLGISQTHGTLERGKAADFIVADGDIFESGTQIADVWIDGQRYKIHDVDLIKPAGSWAITADDARLDGTLRLQGTAGGNLEGQLLINEEEIDVMAVAVDQAARRLRVDVPGSALGLNGPVRLTASLSGQQLYGWAEIAGESRTQWRAERTEDEAAADAEEQPESEANDEAEAQLASMELADLRPAMEYGRPALPEQPERLLVKNATIWTMGPDGIIENADLLVENGRVTRVGQNLSARNAREIDATGKHVTPGLIDAHLHSGVDGINEMGNVITAEVRMADVLNIHNIWMYRQLAGLTTAHVMHGSANPIGGQNVQIKMRWGALSDELLLEGAPRTVKFALGENPKRVGSDRYPETRMGTQEVIADRFRMARDYEARWQRWERTGEGLPPRRDLRLEALADILNGDLLVHSHSYRQDGILALMRLAEEFDFTVKSLHHSVEAYKIASEIAAHGAGAVVWSDWSSFKVEAYDATVYNARLLREAGVLTSLHSDNSQIASRMNWEAAKMVRAGVAPEDALAMVTIDTAHILGIEEHVGSLEAGKDADFVIWSGDPLSTFTKAEQTWIDGRKYFDLEEDARMRLEVEAEREQLIQLILED
ncbi:MAG: amidohydrolase family protein [Cyclonatronaceae bacterium]